MGIVTSFSRLAEYNRRHGIRGTVRRAQLALRRALFAGKSVLFYCDLKTQVAPRKDLPSFLKMERKLGVADMNPEDLQAMTSVWNAKLVQRLIKKRFDLGASLWLIKFRGELAGYGWTLQGRTVEPHYFPLGPEDVQFLDFHVFSKFRGRAIDWFLMNQIMHRLAVEGLGRAYGEAGEWNQASIASFKMTPFRILGVAKKWTVFGRTIVFWSENGAGEQPTNK